MDLLKNGIQKSYRKNILLHWMLFIWKRILHHFILMFMLVFYTVSGALIFVGIEYKDQLDLVYITWDVRDNFLRMMWTLSRKPEMIYDTWRDIFITRFEKDISFLCNNQAWISEDKFEPLWSFGNAVRLCSSIFFTIGYGDMTPITLLGRITAMIYAILGVPFVLYCINFYGSLFTQLTLKVWNLVLRFYYTGRIKGFELLYPPPVRGINMASWIIHSLSISRGGRPDRSSISQAEKRWKSQIKSKKNLITELPLLAAFYFVGIFILIKGYLIFTYLENWNALEAYYYLFTVFLTIGFGDFVLTNTVYMVIIHLMLFLGFVLMTVLLDAIQKNVKNITIVTSDKRTFF